MTNEEAFRLGFIAKLASLQKQANPAAAASVVGPAAAGLGLGLGGIGSSLVNSFSALGNYAVPAAIAAPPALGLVTGALGARATAADDPDEEEVQLDEQRRLLEQLTERARQSRAVKEYRQMMARRRNFRAI